MGQAGYALNKINPNPHFEKKTTSENKSIIFSKYLKALSLKLLLFKKKYILLEKSGIIGSLRLPGADSPKLP